MRLQRTPVGQVDCAHCGRRTSIFAREQTLCAACLRSHDETQVESGVERWGRVCWEYETDPAVARVASIANSDAREALQIAVPSMAAGHPYYAILTGPTGSGKTHALMAVGMALVRHGLYPDEILVGNEHDLLPAGAGDYGHRPIDRWLPSRTKVLLLDELGRGQYSARADGSGSEPQKRLLDHLRRKRISAIFASNLPLHGQGSLETLMDEAAYHRLSKLTGDIELTPGEADQSGTVPNWRQRQIDE